MARCGTAVRLAALAFPHFAAQDQKGNLYITDYFAHRIRKVRPSGLINTVVGNGISGYSGDGGPAKLARVSFPTGILFDKDGNLVFSDKGNHRLRKVDKLGAITTIAGNGTPGYAGDNGPATAASLNGPRGMSLDISGNLYFADTDNHVVRMIDGAGIIHTVAGTGIAGFSGDGGLATAAMLKSPSAVFANGGNLYVADTLNQRVRKVDVNGTITTFAGNGSFGCVGDGGLATLASIARPQGFEIAGGALLISTSSCSRVRAVDLSTNVISTLVGSGSGFNGDGNPPLSTLFQVPQGIFFDRDGSLVIVDSENSRVRRVDLAGGTVSTIAGGYTGDGGPAGQSALNFPEAIAFDSTNNLYIADSFNDRIRRVDTTGNITTIAGTGIAGNTGDGGPATSATLNIPMAVAVDRAGNIFIVDQGGSAIRKIDPLGTITTITVTGGQFIQLTGLATDAAGNLYAADPAACAIWKISTAGTLSAVVGVQGMCGFNSDGIPAKRAWLNSPWGVAIDAAGDLLIADTSNNRARRVDRSTGLISTVAGTGDCGFSGDGGPGPAAMLCLPLGVTASASGTVYIADSDNARVRSVDPSGTIRTLAGTGILGYNGNGLLGTQTNLDFPFGVAVNRMGVLYEVDEGQNRVRRIQ